MFEARHAVSAGDCFHSEATHQAGVRCTAASMTQQAFCLHVHEIASRRRLRRASVSVCSLSTTPTHGAADKEKLVVNPRAPSAAAPAPAPSHLPFRAGEAPSEPVDGLVQQQSTQPHPPPTHAHTPCVFALPVCLPSSHAPSLPKDTHCALVCSLVDGYINCPAAIYLPHPPLATSTRSTHFPPPTNTLQSSEPARSLSGQSTPSPLHRRSCTTAPPHIHTHNYHQIQSQAWTTKTSSTS
jgi:hypothetical protein